MTRTTRLAALAFACAGSLLPVDAARACGCFTPPDPSVPVVQAGERIVFATKDSHVTAHIQIQYAGDAKDFGWLLPLPSLPVLKLGTDELFTQLIGTTQPKYRLTVANSCGGGGTRGLGGVAAPSADQSGGEFSNGGGKSSPLVVQDNIGPYDYAVLKADDKTAMLEWLAANHYFVPAGTDAAVVPYIHAGSFFLALKLRSGKSAGDIQPVIVDYASDLPMIPIVLTSTAAQKDMGIQVWMLGKGRAIPRNYFHTVVNDAAINWITAGANYNDVIIRATHEATGRHTFVTEFAGKTDVMKGVLDAPGRFGDPAELRKITNAVQYVQYLQTHGFPVTIPNQNNGGFGGPFVQQLTFPGTLQAILAAVFPMPAALVAQNTPLAQFFANFESYARQYNLQYTFDPVKLTDDIWMRVVAPTNAAADLFQQFPYMTRLYTTLSPEDMNSDPVFSYNPELPDVNNVHQAVETFHCNWVGGTEGASITTEQGFVIELPDAQNPAVAIDTLPASARIEVLRESGPPEVVTDNIGNIRDGLGQGGCSVSAGSAAGATLGWMPLAAAVALLLRRRRRAG